MGTRYYRRMAIAATLLFAVTLGYVALARGPAAPQGVPEDKIDDFVSVPDVERVVELGSRRDGIPADEFYRILEALKANPGELPSVEPVVPVLPVVDVDGR
jgi:hypothetical protein